MSQGSTTSAPASDGTGKHAFPRQKTKQDAIDCKVRRAKTQARNQQKDIKTKHPDWCRDANKGDYTMLTKKITEDCQKEQMKNEKFRTKLHER